MQAGQTHSKNPGLDLPGRVRVSLGSAMVLGLLEGKLEAKPTTVYLMTYRRGKCVASCGFCPQAKRSRGRADLLSRVSWPAFPIVQVVNGLQMPVEKGEIRRVCIQALNYPEVLAHLLALVKAISGSVGIPISVSYQPPNRESIRLLAQAGVERIGIPLDAATEELFDNVKGEYVGGPYRWEEEFKLLTYALEVFGSGKVSTHLIVGLGETEKEMAKVIQRCVDMGVLPALFAFTPIPGTPLEWRSQPSIQAYRRIQLVRHIVLNGIGRFERMRFDEEGRIVDFGVDGRVLQQIIQTDTPFLTSGCPNCNRPYYNEKPSGPIYNYPRGLTEKERSDIPTLLGLERSSKP